MPESHYPECKPGVRLMGFDPDGDETCLTCRALRACEARVRAEEYVAISAMLREREAKGYAAALDAATEAVAAMRPETDPDIAHVIVSDVLDAIAALRVTP